MDQPCADPVKAVKEKRFLKPQVSVLIPAYNYARYLPACIECVLEQEGVAVEIIVVDDGSTDETPAVAARYARHIRYARQPNQGLSAARNTALDMASCEYIVALDADDLLAPGTLASQCAALERQPDASLCVCPNNLVRSETPDGPLELAGVLPLVRNNYEIYLCNFNIAPVHAYMLRRKAAKATGYFDISLKACEDYDYWVRCVAAGFVLTHNPNGAALYRQHPGSMSANKTNQFKYDAIIHRRIGLRLREGMIEKSRREGAWLSHAAGCLSAAGNLAEQDLELSIAFLKETHFALKQAATCHVLCKTQPDSSPAYRNALTFSALRVCRALSSLKNCRESSVEGALNIMERLSPEWGIEVARMHDAPYLNRLECELSEQIYLPQKINGKKIRFFSA